ncbi:Het-C-domain-containing protein [Mycena pura]|uniref:Het-C-domain-containing protein n=1 Tax=Mycena pura TaxID=153505 RepID=A0AAD6V349_9AGAR|nr:Het-C-domain-containing protein [Mycena pura]
MTSQLNFTTILLVLTVVLVLLPDTVHAFGAGDIPDFAFLNDKAFRHGDIENILSTLAKSAGHAAASNSGNLFGFAKSLIESATSGHGGPKFSSNDIKKVYFGNWLRDYSQAMDIGGLSKLTADTLVLVVSVLGFMASSTTLLCKNDNLTTECAFIGRRSDSLPRNSKSPPSVSEHIDNPKGYGESEGDPRRFHPKLRPPVNPRELEIDPRTGMKNYMGSHPLLPASTSHHPAASENQGWDTSTAHIRRTLTACIEMGRRTRGRDGPELYEAYRLLGTGLHTLEDLLAHSNWVEIALRKMGHAEVFCHVGEDVYVTTPNGRAPPLVTGTFGGADFLHSLMGEAGDKLSQASVTDLASKMNDAQHGDASNISTLKSILSKLPIGGGDDKMAEGEQLHAEAKAYNFDPDNIAPPEVQQKLMQLLRWRDGVMRSILEKIEMIPGLSELMDQLSNALNAYVYTVIAPWVTPILQQATSVLGEGSKAVIDTVDQYEVFDNPRASDPSHSLLSKDHFGLILNEPAGKIAMLVVEHTVKIIVQAWSDGSDPNRALDAILEAFHHPYYATGQSRIQSVMFEELNRWLSGLDQDIARETLNALSKESVRNGKNKRLGSEGESFDEPGYGGCGHGAQPQRKPQGQTQSYGGRGQEQQYGETQSSYSSGRNNASSGYAVAEGYGGTAQADEYSSSRRHGRTHRDEEQSDGQEKHHASRHRNSDDDDGLYSNRTADDTPSYGQRSRHVSSGYGNNEDAHESRRTRERDEGVGYAPSYVQPESQERSSGYDSSIYGRPTQQPETYGGNESYGSSGRGSAEYGGEQLYGGQNRDHGSASSNYRSSGAYNSQGYGGAQETAYGRREERGDEQLYGGQNRGHGSATAYGRAEDASDNYKSSGAYNSQGYGGAQETVYGRREERGGGRHVEESAYGDGYGRQEELVYGSSREEADYGGGRSGYGTEGGYEGNHGETFGMERMNISEQGESHGQRRHHGHHHERE